MNCAGTLWRTSHIWRLCVWKVHSSLHPHSSNSKISNLPQSSLPRQSLRGVWQLFSVIHDNVPSPGKPYVLPERRQKKRLPVTKGSVRWLGPFSGAWEPISCNTPLPLPHPAPHRIPRTDPVSGLCGFAQAWKGFWAHGRQAGFRNVLQTGAIRAFTSRTEPEGVGGNFKKLGWGRWGLDGICSRAALKHSAFF